jgi:hypothetical protein
LVNKSSLRFSYGDLSTKAIWDDVRCRNHNTLLTEKFTNEFNKLECVLMAGLSSLVIFVSKAKSLTLELSTLKGLEPSRPTLLANITLGWKNCQEQIIYLIGPIRKLQIKKFCCY